jgi:hypothetical protein
MTLPDNEKYAAMTAQQAARAFFEACAREDWIEVQKFWRMPVDDRFKQYLGGIETSEKKHGLGLKKDGKTGRWHIDGGI